MGAVTTVLAMYRTTVPGHAGLRLDAAVGSLYSAQLRSGRPSDVATMASVRRRVSGAATGFCSLLFLQGLLYMYIGAVQDNALSDTSAALLFPILFHIADVLCLAVLLMLLYRGVQALSTKKQKRRVGAQGNFEMIPKAYVTIFEEDSAMASTAKAETEIFEKQEVPAQV